MSGCIGVSESYIASYQTCWLKNRGCSIHLMQDINTDTNKKIQEEKFNLNEDIKAKKGLTLVMNMIIQLFLLSSAILNS